VKKAAAFLALLVFLALTAGTAFAWHAPVEGMPEDYQQGDLRGYFIWHDDNGMHLRVRAETHGASFSGTIRTDGVFADVHGRKLEHGDHLWLDNDRNTIRFKFNATRGMDGVDFKVRGGSRLWFELSINGHKARPMQIHLGKEGWHPGSHKFTLRR
jgi:hypothetical protein